MMKCDLLISEKSLKFFPEWRKIKYNLLEALGKYTIAREALEDIGIPFLEIFNLYTNRLASFIIYESYVDSNKEPDYDLMVASELIDIIILHLLDDIIDGDDNEFIEAYGEAKIVAASLPILFEVMKKFPIFTKMSYFYKIDFTEITSVNDYLKRVYTVSFYPIELAFQYIKPKQQIVNFWRNAAQYFKIVDDLKDDDINIPKGILKSLLEEYKNNTIRLAKTKLQTRFVRNALTDDIDWLERRNVEVITRV